MENSLSMRFCLFICSFLFHRDLSCLLFLLLGFSFFPLSLLFLGFFPRSLRFLFLFPLSLSFLRFFPFSLLLLFLLFLLLLFLASILCSILLLPPLLLLLSTLLIRCFLLFLLPLWFISLSSVCVLSCRCSSLPWCCLLLKFMLERNHNVWPQTYSISIIDGIFGHQIFGRNIAEFSYKLLNLWNNIHLLCTLCWI